MDFLFFTRFLENWQELLEVISNLTFTINYIILNNSLEMWPKPLWCNLISLKLQTRHRQRATRFLTKFLTESIFRVSNSSINKWRTAHQSTLVFSHSQKHVRKKHVCKKHVRKKFTSSKLSLNHRQISQWNFIFLLKIQ